MSGWPCASLASPPFVTSNSARREISLGRLPYAGADGYILAKKLTCAQPATILSSRLAILATRGGTIVRRFFEPSRRIVGVAELWRWPLIGVQRAINLTE